jgi:GDP-4-dehydro-6-deoxy-D-mannose reductase
VSKLAAEALCRQWSISEGAPVLLARAFNHIGPGQDPSFAVAGFARQLARIRLGHAPPVIEAGDLEVTRDFTDVRDVVRAYFDLLARGRPATPYNVCSGRETRLRDALDELAALAGVAVEVRVDPARLRPVEQRRVCGSAARLRDDAGWVPRHPLPDSLRASLDEWMHKEGGQG